MYEQERQREINLLLLLVYTVLIIVLTVESLLFGWEMGAVVLLVLGAVVGWWGHMTDKISASMRVWLYFILSMLAFFFYGIHETSMYDLAPAMILVMILYSVTEDFLTNVSHELRTPINAVTGITAVMLKNEEDEDKRKDIISIQNAGHRLFRQIGDILDYTEIDTGRIKVSEDTYMITSLINDFPYGSRIGNTASQGIQYG